MVTNLINSNGRTVANQFVITDGAKTVFQSYNSDIVMIDSSKKTLKFGSDYKYSTTTIKYRNRFLSDYFNTSVDTKMVDKAVKDGSLFGYKVSL